jgi:glycosyltransferase involved in cell wall biosynthesis
VADDVLIPWSSRCAAVIPCHNEARTVSRVVDGVRRHLSEVIVVDDGSSDITAQAAQAAGARVISIAKRQGKGAALSAGWSEAFRRGFSWAVNLDGDGQHDPEEIPAFLVRAERSRAPLVIGNRMGDPRGMPKVRRWVNQWMSRRLSKVAGQGLPDSQCGFRLMDLAAWSGLAVSSRHFEIESEILLAFLGAGFRVEFVPIRTVYLGERSKINPVQDTFRWFRWLHGTRRASKEAKTRAAGHDLSRKASLRASGEQAP